MADPASFARQSPARRLRRWAGRFLSDTRLFLVLAVAVGLTAGTIAFLLERGIHAAERLLFNGFADLAGAPWRARLVILAVPALGGALVGLTLRAFRTQGEFHGVIEVLHAVIRRGSRIPLIPAFVRGFSTILTIGTGGSGGPEAPIVHMGAAVGSAFGRWRRVPADYLRILVAAGAAGGVAAAFNAPLGGVMFSLEVILQDFTAHAFSLVVIASVTAAVAARALLGGEAFFRAPLYGLNSPWELGLYAVLGLLAGVLAKIFMHVLGWAEEIFQRLRCPAVWRPALGGLLVGLLGFFLPQVLGSGRVWVQSAIDGKIPLLLCGVLIAGKVLCTSFTLGSGGSGGVFLPVLFAGAMLGEGLGLLVQRGFPQTIHPGAYALGGMAALFAGAFHAPITAILILFELTRDYELILPFMLASVIAALVSRTFHPESLNTFRLSKLGIRQQSHREISLLDNVPAAQAMTAPAESISQDLPLEELPLRLRQSAHHGFPVVDHAGAVVGILTSVEMRDYLADASSENRRVRDIMRDHFPAVLPTDSLAEVLRLMHIHELDRVPVVLSKDQGRLVGIVAQADILKIYKSHLPPDPRYGRIS